MKKICKVLSLQMIFSKKTDAQLKHPLFKKFLFIWKHPALTLTLPAYFNAASALTTNSHVRCVDEILNSSFVVWILFICGPNDTASSPGNLDAKILLQQVLHHYINPCKHQPLPHVILNLPYIPIQGKVLLFLRFLQRFL